MKFGILLVLIGITLAVVSLLAGYDTGNMGPVLWIIIIGGIVPIVVGGRRIRRAQIDKQKP